MLLVGLVQRRRQIVSIITGVAVIATVALAAPTASAAPSFVPARVDVTGWTRQAGPSPLGVALAGPSALPGPAVGDGIGPGSYLLIDQTDGNSYICSANFVWSGGGGPYLGAAGHCFLPAGVDRAPLGAPSTYVTRVQVCVSSCLFGGQLGAVIQGNFAQLGAVRYARQSLGDGNDVGNDFGLVAIPAGLQPQIRRTVPVWGGPSGPASTPGVGQPVCLYGNAGGLGEVFATKARAGVSGVPSADGSAWFATVPSFQGDSGSAVVNCPGLTGGAALGVLTHLATNGTGVIAGTTVSRARAMAGEAGLAIDILQ